MRWRVFNGYALNSRLPGSTYKRRREERHWRQQKSDLLVALMAAISSRIELHCRNFVCFTEIDFEERLLLELAMGHWVTTHISICNAVNGKTCTVFRFRSRGQTDGYRPQLHAVSLVGAGNVASRFKYLPIQARL